MPHATQTAENNSATLPANETWVSPTTPRNRAATLGHGIALTASFAATLIKRAYGPPYSVHAQKHRAPQPTTLAKANPHATPTH